MKIENSIKKPFWSIFLFLLISAFPGLSLALQVDKYKAIEIMELSVDQNRKKNPVTGNKSGCKKEERKKNKKIQECTISNFSDTYDQEEDFESSVKSYGQLKGLLEEVDLMVGGWI